MDKKYSEHYKKMCDYKSLRPWSLKKGNQYYHSDYGVFIYGQIPENGTFDQKSFYYYEIDKMPEQCIWLRTIEQIKELFNENSFGHLIGSFDKITTDFHDYFEDFESDEEKWLAYYMWLINKKWSKEDYTWVDKK